MAKRDAEKFLATPEGRIAYRKWLEDPVTKLVFETMESRSRPMCRKEGSTALDHAQANGYVAGVWGTLDSLRTLDELLAADGPTAEQPQAGYAPEGG